MISVCQKALQPAFNEKNHSLFEDEVNRLFRTNEFNVSAHILAFKVLVTTQNHRKNMESARNKNQLKINSESALFIMQQKVDYTNLQIDHR